jgi:hypothetical protein
VCLNLVHLLQQYPKMEKLAAELNIQDGCILPRKLQTDNLSQSILTPNPRIWCSGNTVTFIWKVRFYPLSKLKVFMAFLSLSRQIICSWLTLIHCRFFTNLYLSTAHYLIGQYLNSSVEMASLNSLIIKRISAHRTAYIPGLIAHSTL